MVAEINVNFLQSGFCAEIFKKNKKTINVILIIFINFVLKIRDKIKFKFKLDFVKNNYSNMIFDV